jgi:hypothetical protein
MPLEGFRILQWAGDHFGSMPPAFLGGVGVAVLIAAVVMLVSGFRLHPTSWSLVVAGAAACVLTYFIVAAAIHAASTTLAGGDNVAQAAPRVVPWATALVAVGLAGFGLRLALRSWSTEETSSKAAGLLVGLLSLAMAFVGVQIVRGAHAPAAAPSHSPAQVDDVQGPSSPDDSTIRRRGGLTGGRH